SRACQPFPFLPAFQLSFVGKFPVPSKFPQKIILQTSLSVYGALTMKKPNAKQRILETAGELFFQRGYSGVGINEIIEKAGTAKASFYQHYPSKESLCEAWLRSVHEQSEAQRAAILAEPKPPEEKLSAWFEELEIGRASCRERV